MTALSVVMPTYEAAGWVAGTLRAVLAQAVDDLEVVVVDDGSRDATVDVCRDVAAQDPRVRVVALEHNAGVSHARQVAVAQARGEHVWFVDSDDHVVPGAAARLLAAARADDADVVLARARFVYPDATTRPVPSPAPGTRSGPDVLRALLRGEASGHLWNKLLRRDLLHPEDFVTARTHSDLALAAAALGRARSAVSIDAHVYDYRLRAGSIITTRRSRSESLRVVGDAVARTAAAHGIGPGDPDYDYFRCRFITLSAVKDLVTATDEPDVARLATLRAEIGLPQLRALAARGDTRRLALALTARCSLPAHRVLLALAAR
ncbi:glycosyltransferase family 2 protein [Cellulomonas dongxiuzhuiae]|uniref:glycosyltransferase family 2 protein n=1 Tax=Cellulomonas dongxiuzhuiae TaxID=2819979 RepID=UPI001AAE33CC|nr:glycosyltransferase family 2 protein [Cellulomonas dongxiuzhuiae]MBO3088781.1 glycosyltransferase family 2 protein [Cellulomonas dongxiuzhuiae]